MASRKKLDALLRSILGSSNVYFQPPESVKMSYPAIVYSLNGIDPNNADNGVYLLPRSYTVKLIHKDPDNSIIDEIAKLPMCKFDRHFRADNLNHYVYKLYY